MKRGFLLINTGSPSAPTPDALHAYLKKFLMDPYVISVPFPMRYAIVHGIILPKRPAQSAKAYQKIWTEEGSPLVSYSKSLANKLAKIHPEPIELAMVYGEPCIEQAIDNLLATGVTEIAVLPLFPQHARAVIAPGIREIKKVLKHRDGSIPLRLFPPFYNHPTYIQAIAESLKPAKGHLLFSYHGLPLYHLAKQPKPDYLDQCLATTEALIAATNWPAGQWSIAFQSRLGRARWTKPYTEQVLNDLPADGVKHLTVVCPAFICDNLETLEEISIRGKQIFLDAGGESFQMIPCLNDSANAVKCLQHLISQNRSSILTK